MSRTLSKKSVAKKSPRRAAKRAKVACTPGNTDANAIPADQPWRKFYTSEQKNLTFPKQTLYEYLHECNQNNHSDYAINYLGGRLTYNWLFCQIETIAKSLVALGIKKGEIVSICSLLTPETLALFYALNKIGAASNWLDPRIHPDDKVEQINEVKSAVLFTLSPFVADFTAFIKRTSITKVIVMSPLTQAPWYLKILASLKNLGKSVPAFSKSITNYSWEDFLTLGENRPLAPAAKYRPNTLAVILHTGGTTGKSKGVMLSNDSINAETHQVRQLPHLDFTIGKRWLSYIPPFIVVGLVNHIHLAFVLSMENIILPSFTTFTLGKQVAKYRPNNISCVSLHLRDIVDSPELKDVDLSFLKNIIVGADTFDLTLEKRIEKFMREHNCQVSCTKCYGATETSSVCIAGCNHEPYNLPGSIGIPLAGTKVGIFNHETNERMSVGKIGEMCITGPTIMMGYYGSPKTTKEALRTHHGATWLHTGDSGHLNKDGVVFIDGRIKRIIIRRGFKIYPIVIEKLFQEFPEVKMATVVGIPHADDVEVPRAHLELKPEFRDMEEVVEQKLRQLCEAKLVDYQIPVEYRFHNQLPTTPNGKADYRTLEKLP